MDDNYLKVIPLPASININSKDRFYINSDTVIQVSPELEDLGLFLKERLYKDSSIDIALSVVDNQENDFDTDNRIVIDLDSDYMERFLELLPKSENNYFSEGYCLKSGPDGIILKSFNKEGVFRGIQTLRQLIPLNGKTDNKIIKNGTVVPSLEIADFPRFSWRGFMFDVARHFYGVDTIKQIIDAMALMKMNILHLHLCDDQGWRIQIDRYPFLTEKGAFRKESRSNGFLGRKSDGMPHYGYYTKGDIREIVDYAARNFITVIPEIEMPGHCSAALASYPFLGCRSVRYEVATSPGIKKDIYCAGKDFTYEFLQNVIDEVLELFPSKWIHLGGDEAPVTRWKNCPFCLEKIKKEKLKDEKGLQRHFMEIMTAYTRERGRVPLTWNDILWEKTSTDTIIQYWLRGRREVKDHLARGGKIVASHFFHTYLDYNHGVLPLSKIYSYNPVFKDIEGQFTDNILGMEAPLWTESAKTIEHVYSFAFPRLTALAENSWTLEDRKNLKDFINRLYPFLERLRFMGISHTDIRESDPGVFKRLMLWKKIHRQSSDLPEKIIKPV